MSDEVNYSDLNAIISGGFAIWLFSQSIMFIIFNVFNLQSPVPIHWDVANLTLNQFLILAIPPSLLIYPSLIFSEKLFYNHKEGLQSSSRKTTENNHGGY